MSAEEPRPSSVLALATLRHPSLPLAGWDAPPESTVRAAVEREGPAVLTDLAVDALRALALLHDLGLPHAALLPSSLRVRDSRRLGSRLVLLPPPLDPVDLAGSAATLPFVAPEALDGRPWSRASDVYALGAVLFHALHGRPHLRIGDDPLQARAVVLEGRRTRPSAPAGAPPWLAVWLDHLLALDPARRPASAREALVRLADATGFDGPLETPAGRAARIASARPPGLELECEEISRLVDRSDGPRVVLVPCVRDGGVERVLDWLALRARLDGRADLVWLDEPVDAADAVRLARTRDARVVAAVRPARVGTEPWPGVAVVRLRGLDREMLRALAERADGLDRTLDARAARIGRRADGRYGAAAFVAAVDRETDGIATSLSPASSALAAVFGAIDAPLPEDLAARLAGLDPDVSRLAAAELRIVGWLSERDGTWAPRIPRLARRTLPALDAEACDRLRRGAEALSASGAESLAIRMLVAAGRIDDALDRARGAATRAIERGDAATSVGLARLGLAIVARRDPRRLDLRLVHARALARAGRLRAAQRALEAVWRGTSGERLELAAERERLRARLSALDAVEDGSPADPRADACARARLAAQDLARGRLDRALDGAQAVDELARLTDDRLLRSFATALRGHALALVERSSDAVPSSDLDPDWVGLREQIAAARSALEDGRIDDAIRTARDAAAAAERIDAPGEGAEAWSIAARASAHESDRALARRTGLALLEAACARVDDPVLRRAFADHPRFAALRDRPADLAVADRRLLAIYEMIRRVNSETDPEALLPAILSMALEVVRADRGLILLLARDGSVRVRAAQHLESETLADAETFSRGVVAQAAAGRAVLAFDAAGDERFADLRSVSLYGIRSLMCVPLRSRGTLIGTVYVDHRGERGRFDAEDLRFLEAFADHAALALENAEARATLCRENRELRAEAGAGLSELVSDSEPMRRVLDRIRIVAQSNLPVLITGESGTGKELVARAIHFHGGRRDRPFVSENCAALPETLLEAELFGHVRGAFTGAERARAGLFEQADRGTLLLDEVGDMSSRMQAQLLRVLETGEVRRVGADRTQRVDARVVAATHRDLDAASRAGAFRADLLYRLQVLTVELPPLRDRPGDVRRLTDVFLARAARERRRPMPPIDPAARERLERHDWPGNVRELANVVARAVVLAGDGSITEQLLDGDPSLRPRAAAGPGIAGGPEPLATSEVRIIREALRASAGNRAHAARLLGISRATMYRRLRELGAEFES
jgi:serine/threonine-protein kinase PknK